VPWILYPNAADLMEHPNVELATTFSREFEVGSRPETATMRIAGFRRYAMAINGVALSITNPIHQNWKQPEEQEVANLLKVGTNRLTVTVWNSNGPPALWLMLKVGELVLTTDQTWRSSLEGATTDFAMLADEIKSPWLGAAQVREHGGIGGYLKSSWKALIVFFVVVVSAALVLSSRRFSESNLAGWRQHKVAGFAPVIVIALMWSALFLNNLPQLPSRFGFDVDGHIDYVNYIQKNHALPHASEGWEMFQPPLYYMAGAGILELIGLTTAQDSGISALRIFGMVIGLGHVAFVWASLRILFPVQMSRSLIGVMLAGALAPVIYLAQYVTNEALAAALISGCVYLALRQLQQAVWTSRSGIYLGIMLGGAILTKATALILVPLLAGAFLLQWQQTKSQPFPKLLAKLGVVFTVCLVVGGWHYVRTWIHTGVPLVGGWDPRGGVGWWSDNGYQTRAFYSRFGNVLLSPWFASSVSFADGIYSTLWGDGALGGCTTFSNCPPWNYDLMAVGYWLALIPTVLILCGIIYAVRLAIRRPSPEWFLLLGVSFMLGLALLQLSIKVPFHCAVKAFYCLGGLVPLCAFAVMGGDVLNRVRFKLRFVVYVMCGLWALNSFASFWIVKSSAMTRLIRATAHFEVGRLVEAEKTLTVALEQYPEDRACRLRLIDVLEATGNGSEARRHAGVLLEKNPNDAEAHCALASLLSAERMWPEVVAHADRAVALCPELARAHEILVLGLQAQNSGELVRAARAGLKVSPYSAPLRVALGLALIRLGDQSQGENQIRLATQLNPRILQNELSESRVSP
jgi:hypothetical protein